MLKQFFACCVLALTVTAPRAAQPECGTLGLAFYELGALYYSKPDGGWAGIDKDIVDELEKRTGCHFQATLESRVRIWTLLASGKLDMSVSGISTPEREKFARFVPYFSTRNYVLLRKGLSAAAGDAGWFFSQPGIQGCRGKKFQAWG